MEKMRGMKIMSDKRNTKGFIALPNYGFSFFNKISICRERETSTYFKEF
jgi:hypothetical protein